MRRLRVLSVASEVYPIVKTGGLADVTGALPTALAAENITVTTLVPGYPAVMDALREGSVIRRFPDLFGGEARLVVGTAAGLDLLVLDAPHLFARPGNPYAGPDGRDWPDNAFRFAALGRVAADIGLGAIEGITGDIVHAHDWHAGLAPAYLHYSGGRHAASVVTIHNLAFQGKFPPELLGALGLPPHAYTADGIEYYGAIGYLKAALRFADRITTVSPSYAAEILTDEGGMGLEKLLRERAAVLTGIRNGIDDSVWNPATDSRLPAHYDLRKRKSRAKNTAALQARLGLDPDPKALVFGVVSRLSWQKGIDLLLDALPCLLENGAQLAMLGAGDAALERGFAVAAKANAGRIGCEFGYDESLAHLIQGGATALLVPSRFEPCGLTQLCALRYGAVPVVARVGGLNDTIVDANEMALAAGVATGIQFAPGKTEHLEAAIRRTVAIHRDRPAWARLQANGMATDVSWRSPARAYAALYRRLRSERGART